MLELHLAHLMKLEGGQWRWRRQESMYKSWSQVELCTLMGERNCPACLFIYSAHVQGEFKGHVGSGTGRVAVVASWRHQETLTSSEGQVTPCISSLSCAHGSWTCHSHERGSDLVLNAKGTDSCAPNMLACIYALQCLMYTRACLCTHTHCTLSCHINTYGDPSAEC